MFAYEPDEKRAADEALLRENLWPTLNRLLREVTVCDPACGSGSFLVGMLAVLDDLQARANAQLGEEETPYERRKRIIGQSLYGVDVMPWAVHVAELRLWLQLVVETELQWWELKARPVLPYLSFKVRAGDSLVQEVGGLNFTLDRRQLEIPRHLKGRLTQLKGEKLKFYHGDPTAKFRSEKALRDEELILFRDILTARREALDGRLADGQRRLAETRMTLEGEVVPVLDKKAAQSLAAEVETWQVEQQQVEAALAALRQTRTVPFVWDIAFVEIFEGDRGGFDLVIGNPPYVQQEKIAPPTLREADFPAARWRELKAGYKAQLQRSVAAAWPRFFGYKPGSDKFRKLDGKSDLYVYFYLHGLRLLNDQGAFCFITSNSWLDVGYGADLQEFLLKHGHVKMILDNEAKRTFAQADVNTIIALLGPPGFVVSHAAQRSGVGHGTLRSGAPDYEPGLDETARFVMFRVPFEQALSPVVWEEVEAATDRLARPEFRVLARPQAELYAEGLAAPEKEELRQPAVRYEGNKWGGKYLRAPDIFFTILEKGRGKLVRLGDLAEVRRGFTTGANEFFYLDEEKIAEWGIERGYLKPVIKTPRDHYAIVIPNERREYLFWCETEKRALKGTGALEYIQWGEKQRFQERPSCRGRRPWYSLNGPTAPTLLFPSAFFERYICYECPKGFVADKVFYTITAPNLSTATKAFLNSSVLALFMEVEGYQLNHGGIFNTVEWLKHFPVLGGSNPEVEEAYLPLLKRDIRLVADEVKEPTRRALDAAVLRALDLPESLLDALYEEICSRAHGRILKARRQPTKRGREEGEEA